MRLCITNGSTSALGARGLKVNERCAADGARAENAALIARLGEASDTRDAVAAEADLLRQDLRRAQQEQAASVHALQVSRCAVGLTNLRRAFWMHPARLRSDPLVLDHPDIIALHRERTASCKTSPSRTCAGTGVRRHGAGYQVLGALPQARHEAALMEAQTAAAAAMAREQRTVAAREQEIADLTLALAGRTAEVKLFAVIVIITLRAVMLAITRADSV